jgi:methylmalonyl-CoA/ethylmalonyl-CoA epimerase
MKKIEHIGIAVKDIEASNKVFSTIFGKENYKAEKVELEGVATSFFQIGDSKIELVAATNPDSPIAKYLEKNRESLHHIAFDVEDIKKEMNRLLNAGIRTLNENPKKGADNKLICFLHPKDTNGVLIELCQAIK